MTGDHRDFPTLYLDCILILKYSYFSNYTSFAYSVIILIVLSLASSYISRCAQSLFYCSIQLRLKLRYNSQVLKSIAKFHVSVYVLDRMPPKHTIPWFLMYHFKDNQYLYSSKTRIWGDLIVIILCCYFHFAKPWSTRALVHAVHPFCYLILVSGEILKSHNWLL